LEATKVLRDEDLNNVQLVRSKLAEKTRELERLQAQTGRVSPSRTRPGSFFERRNTTDLFTAAKVAALEQRALELEKRNSDLVTRLEASQAGDGIDDLNRLTAHQAWKGTVTELESKIKTQNAELERLRPGGGASTSASSGPAQMDWYRIEALLEEHASYRENVGGKLQALRSEKETLQKDLHRKENECQGLELKVQTLQRRMSVL
jgi:chromosome segregation ATPase